MTLNLVAVAVLVIEEEGKVEAVADRDAETFPIIVGLTDGVAKRERVGLVEAVTLELEGRTDAVGARESVREGEGFID